MGGWREDGVGYDGVAEGAVGVFLANFLRFIGE